jgi:RNA polymerase sigma-70 factor (ECF subfamily)
VYRPLPAPAETNAVLPDIMLSMGPPGDDERRFRHLFDDHRRAVLGYALRRVADPADAADVLAETFLTAWRRLDDVPPDDETRPWLLGVARRVLANQRRGARRHAGLADRLADELATQLPALTGADTADVGLREALTRVPERDREVLLLSAWEDLTPAQIAAVTGLRRATVRTRLHRARRRLRAELELDQAKPSPIYDLAKEQTS